MLRGGFAAAVAVVVVVVMAGCQPTLPSYTVHVPPRLVEVRPPRSVIFARTEISLDRAREALDGVLPPEISGGGQLGFGSAKWHLSRRPAQFGAQKDGLAVEISEIGELEAALGPVRCKSDHAGFIIGAHGRPALTGAGELSLAELRVALTPVAPLDCGGVPVPLGRLLERAAGPLGDGVAAALRFLKLPLAPLLDRALDELAKPRALDVDGRPACLDLDPSALVLAPLTGDGGRAVLRGGVDAAPRFSLAACPASPPARARPAVRVRELALDEKFRVDVAAALPHDELERRLARDLVGKRFGDGGRSLTITAVQLGDAGGRVLLRLDVTGALHGALYLWGTPAIVARGGKFFVELPDLQVAAETESLVARVALWIWKLRDGGLPAAVARQLSFDVTAPIEDARRALTRRFTLGDSGWWLDVTIERIEPGQVFSRPGALTALARLVGHAELAH